PKRCTALERSCQGTAHRNPRVRSGCARPSRYSREEHRRSQLECAIRRVRYSRACAGAMYPQTCSRRTLRREKPADTGAAEGMAELFGQLDEFLLMPGASGGRAYDTQAETGG